MPYFILLKKEDAHEDPIYCCAWAKTNITDDPKGPFKDFIATGGLDGLVKIWLFERNKLNLVYTLEEHCMAVVSVAISADGHTLASSSLDSSLVIWDLLYGKKVYKIENTTTDMFKVAFAPDGRQIVTGSHTGKLSVFGIANCTLEKFLDTRGKFVLCVAWSPDGRHIASGAMDGVVCLFDVSQGKLLHTIQAHHASVNSVAFSPDSLLLITASDDGFVNVYNVASASVHNSTNYKTWVNTACLAADGRSAAGLADGSTKLDHCDRELAAFHENTGAVCGVQFNAEGNKLLTVSKDKSIIIYETPIPPKPAAKK